jgi:GNAT superfamily N-acetyltransferase
VSPETCRGLFIRAADGDHLLAHTISTKTDNERIHDVDMSYPEDWKVNSTVQSIGHRPGGRTIALHSLAVSPSHQKAGLGKSLMKAYIEEMRHTGKVDRIAILTYERLVPYYVNLGFTNYGKSVSEYAGVAWQALVSASICTAGEYTYECIGL